ncbi:MAG: ribonuclease HII [Pseudomonadota bacterium]
MESTPDDRFETELRTRGLWPVAGIDEAGRGPLCGPVVAAAVILDPAAIPEGLNDSKKLTAPRREALFDRILSGARVGVGQASVAEIDELNILRASHLAMCRAVAALPVPPAHVLVDGPLLPRDLAVDGTAVVRGDARCLSIAAASIVAKVTRDRIMVDLAQQHPGYGWDRNAGYPTPDHLAALRNLGVTPQHRRSFRPVHYMLLQEKSPSR